MEQKRDILVLADPLRRQDPFSQMQIQSTTLVFHENERYLSQAQSALQRQRRRADWLCVAAAGAAVGIALALAAQLPVEKLALRDCVLFDRRRLRKGPRQLKAVAAFARQNLSLVISRLMLADTAQAEIRRIIRGISSYAELAVWTQNDAGKGWIEAFLQR